MPSFECGVVMSSVLTLFCFASLILGSSHVKFEIYYPGIIFALFLCRSPAHFCLRDHGGVCVLNIKLLVPPI